MCVCVCEKKSDNFWESVLFYHVDMRVKLRSSGLTTSGFTRLLAPSILNLNVGQEEFCF